MALPSSKDLPNFNKSDWVSSHPFALSKKVKQKNSHFQQMALEFSKSIIRRKTYAKMQFKQSWQKRLTLPPKSDYHILIWYTSDSSVLNVRSTIYENQHSCFSIPQIENYFIIFWDCNFSICCFCLAVFENKPSTFRKTLFWRDS